MPFGNTYTDNIQDNIGCLEWLGAKCYIQDVLSCILMFFLLKKAHKQL